MTRLTTQREEIPSLYKNLIPGRDDEPFPNGRISSVDNQDGRLSGGMKGNGMNWRRLLP